MVGFDGPRTNCFTLGNVLDIHQAYDELKFHGYPPARAD